MRAGVYPEVTVPNDGKSTPVFPDDRIVPIDRDKS